MFSLSLVGGNMEVTIKINSEDFMNFLKLLSSSNIKIEGIHTEGMRSHSSTINLKKGEYDGGIPKESEWKDYLGGNGTSSITWGKVGNVTEHEMRLSDGRVRTPKDFSEEVPLRMMGNTL